MTIKTKTEARLVMACQTPNSPITIYRSFAQLGQDISYHWIRMKLIGLHERGLLVKRTSKGLSTKSKTKGANHVYYTATKEAIAEAQDFLEAVVIEKEIADVKPE